MKPMQELHTMLDLILLGVHTNTFAEDVTKDLRIRLAKAELDMILRKQLFEDTGEGIYDCVSEQLNNN